MQKYSDSFMEWIAEAGFTHCFFVAGGNAMHLLESASSRFECIPFINEIGAGIAAESFNEVCSENQRAFVLVTAGPGLTNLTTAVASSWADRRELFIVGGQAKSSTLSRGRVRQIGFQETDGVAIMAPITKVSVLVDHQIGKEEVWSYVQESRSNPRGPVFLEVCLDISMQETEDEFLVSRSVFKSNGPVVSEFDKEIDFVINKISSCERPLILIGGAIDRNTCKKDLQRFMDLGIPIATTFNGADRCGIEYKYYAGRPNWYGSRWANLIIQQADLIIAIGARLGLMETGYNWESFAPRATVVHVEIEQGELCKGHPRTDRTVQGDPNVFLKEFSRRIQDTQKMNISTWQELILKVKQQLVKPEKSNTAREGYVEYASFVYDLTSKLSESDMINPCSSGGNFESFGKVMVNKTGQKWVTSPGLASMGFGLSGGVGMALAYPNRRTLVFEGDGGLAQNLQEFGVVRSNNLNMKIFIADNGNYGSIKAHQKSAFNNHYIGCDKETGLWLPDWEKVAQAFDIPVLAIQSNNYDTLEFQRMFASVGPTVFVVRVDPDQIIFPKIVSARDSKGLVVSNPLHIMEPPLTEIEMNDLCPYLC